ncbi:MAG: hypothetical protein ACYTFG_19015, partial [Planctomycetota bacterium]
MDEDGEKAPRPSPSGVKGWVKSFEAGTTDGKGRYMGGSEILHLVGHAGKLYAANGSWMDSRNLWYGGKDLRAGWAQVLRLDAPDGKWEVDLELGPMHLRPTALKSVSFTTDGRGKPLDAPVNLLLTAAVSPRAFTADIRLFVRDDKKGTWERTTIHTGKRPKKLGTLSVRDLHVHRDRETGVDRIFITLGVLGIFSGVYDAKVPGKIRWDKPSESGRVKTRPLALLEANGSLLFSADVSIYKRIDGEAPSYEVVHDLSDVFGGRVNSDVGGIRGLTALPNPSGPGDSLLFVLGESGLSRGWVYRLDPDGKGGYERTREVRLGSLIGRYLDGNPVHYVLAGYNDIPSVVDPVTRETVHLIGCEAKIGGRGFHTTQRKAGGGFYAGALYAVRNRNGKYRMREINGPIAPGMPDLVATRAFAMSPFAKESGDVIYFGGHDCNFFPSRDTG